MRQYIKVASFFFTHSAEYSRSLQYESKFRLTRDLARPLYSLQSLRF